MERRRQTGAGGLIEFVAYFWDVLEPVAEFVEGDVLRAMCLHLEAVADGRIKRLLMNVSPGMMKSLLTDVFFPAWVWTACDRPDKRIVAFSYAAHLTERDNAKFRDLIRSAKFQELWGHKFALTEDGKVKVANSKTGSKFASSVGGVGTGERGDIIIFDDPHNVKEAESEVVRAETVRWFREGMQNRLNDLRTGAIIVIMQRVHEADVSGCIIENYPDYVHLCIPMEYDQLRHCETEIGWSDWRSEPGELAWPERFPADSLVPFQQLPFLWAGQYQQSPSPRGGGILPRAGWEEWDGALALKFGRNERQFPDFEYVVASADTAYTEKQENDYSALVVMGVWSDVYGRPKLMVMSAWQERLTLNDLVNKIMATCRRLKVDRLLIEAKASGLSVAQEIRRLNGEEEWAVQTVNPGAQDKTARAYSIQHLLGEELPNGTRREGIVYVPCRTHDGGMVLPITWADLLITQCENFPKGAHDDLVDAFVQAMRHLRDCGMARRSDEMIVQEHHDSLAPMKPTVPLYPQ